MGDHTEEMEWVEIVEPKSQNFMYANLVTGECKWEEPAGQRVKKADQNQWWELYDGTTDRYYYYNATNFKTVWERPENCDIVPLAKLQRLKQNTEVQEYENGRSSRRIRDSGSAQSHPLQNGNSSNAATTKKDAQCERLSQSTGGSVRKLSSQTQTTPQPSPKESKRHQTHHHHNHKCTHSHALRSSNSQGITDHAVRGGTNGAVSSQRQFSTSFQQRAQPSHNQNIFDQDLVNGWRHEERFQSPSIPVSSPHLMGSSYEMGRTPSPRSPAVTSHEIPSGSLSRSRLYENHKIDPNCPSFDPINPVPSTSSSFSQQRTSPMTGILPRRQRSFDQKNSSFFDNGEGSLPYRRGNDSVYQAAVVPSGIRSVESTPRIQRRNTDALPLPQISETGYRVRVKKDDNTAFAISGGTPMQSRKKKSLTKSNGSSQDTVTAPQPTSGSSSQSHSSLESKQSVFGSKLKQPSTRHHEPVIFPQSDNRQDKILLTPITQRVVLVPQENSTTNNNSVGLSSFMTLAANLKRTVSVDRHDVKSPSSDGSSSCKTSTPFSPKLQRRVTAGGKVAARMSPAELEADRKAEEVLKKAKECLHEANTQGFGERGQNGHRFPTQSPSAHKYSPNQQQHSDLDTDSEDNDADVEDSDDFDEEDEDDEDLDDVIGDASGKNRYGHLSPSQLRTHPNYYAIDRSPIKPLQSAAKPSTEAGAGSSDEDDEEDEQAKLTALHQKVQNMSMNMVDTRHASLRRKPPNQGGLAGGKLPGLEKSQSMQTELSAQQQPRPMSVVLPTQSEASLISSTKSSSPVCRPMYTGLNGTTTLTRDRSFMESEADAHRQAQVKLNDHTKGLFRKKVSIQSLLSWSKDSIKKPLIMTSDKSAKKESCTMYRLVQMYMGDRKAKDNKSQDEIALELTRLAWQKPSLRDELFIQICKQTTENHKPESLRRGWELMAICLAFFPPSTNFFAYLHTYIARFQSPACNTFEVQVSHYASHCAKRLERMSQTGAKRGIRKPTVEEIQQARVQIFHPSLFGNTLEDVMQLQKERYPERHLPWIQTILSDEILRLSGTRTEGIFRVPGDIDEVNMLKVRMDRWNKPDCSDPHVPSSLLKLWYRELYEPLIPARFYDLCVQHCSNPRAAVRIIEHDLPEINRLVLTYLLHFLQLFAQPENVLITKMDAPNLAMVMAPNCLRCMSDDPQIIFENTRKEMTFIRTLMQHLDTSWVEGIQ